MTDCRVCRFFRSTLGMKVLMAVTGVVLFGYTIGHVSGNLLVFAGREKLDAYSKFLHESTLLLWGTRVLLLASVLVHIWASIKLTQLKSDSRPVPYGLKQPHGSTYAARTMMWSGPIIALFVIYHILHLTTGTVHSHLFEEGKVYDNLVRSFRQPLQSGIYIAAMLALGLHLSHGVWSMLQTVGINRPRWEKGLRCLALTFGVLICGGFIAVPLSILLKIVR